MLDNAAKHALQEGLHDLQQPLLLITTALLHNCFCQLRKGDSLPGLAHTAVTCADFTRGCVVLLRHCLPAAGSMAMQGQGTDGGAGVGMPFACAD